MARAYSCVAACFGLRCLKHVPDVVWSSCFERKCPCAHATSLRAKAICVGAIAITCNMPLKACNRPTASAHSAWHSPYCCCLGPIAVIQIHLEHRKRPPTESQSQTLQFCIWRIPSPSLSVAARAVDRMPVQREASCTSKSSPSALWPPALESFSAWGRKRRLR